MNGCQAFSDDFYIWRFKVDLCQRADNHDWSRCPFAHAKEKARRRDPRAFKYASLPCPDTMQARARGARRCGRRGCEGGEGGWRGHTRRRRRASCRCRGLPLGLAKVS